VILDSSAVLGILLGEDGHDRLIEAVEAANAIAIGAPTVTESSNVLVNRYGVVGRLMVSRFLEENRVTTLPFDQRHSSAAVEAFIRYGKGRHPARLNYGDCMTYATAQIADAPLLFVGDDFSKTDLIAA
jgi:ribonuclease VapC